MGEPTKRDRPPAAPVLLIEDDPAEALVVRRTLLAAGLANPVVHAATGAQALGILDEALAPGAPDDARPVVTLLDLHLPDMRGLDVLRWIRGRSSLTAMPVVVMSASDAPADILESRIGGVRAYLVKPVAFAALADVVRNLDLAWVLTHRPARHARPLRPAATSPPAPGTVEAEPAIEAAEAADDAAVVSALSRALAAGTVRVAYQPIVDLRSGRITAVEALARCDDPGLYGAGPARFIPVAERSGLIGAIGDRVLRNACGAVASWRETLGDRCPVMHVNVSAEELSSPDYLQRVARAIHDARIPPAMMVLEVTETSIMRDLDAVVGRLNDARSLGVALAIDDFGTGYSSLAYLQRLPVDIVKIDRSFIEGLRGAPEGWNLAQAIIRLIDSLGLASISEGVEDATQFAHVHALGCTAAQGFYWGEPVAADSIRHLVVAS